MGWFKGRTTDSGAKTQVYMGGSKTVLGFAYQAKRRSRVVMTGIGVGVVVAASTAVGVMKYLEAEASARVVDQYGALSRCLLGEPPTEGELLSRRYRAMQLTVLTQADVQRPTDKAGPWPDRCGTYAHGLHEALSESKFGEEKGKVLIEPAKALADAIDLKDGYWRDISSALDRAFGEAMRSGLILKPRPDVPTPPAPAQTLTLDTLAKAGIVTERAVALSEVRPQLYGDDTVRFLVDDSKAGERLFCSIGLDSARCTPLSKEAVAHQGPLRLDLSIDAGAAPLYLGYDAVFGFDGSRHLDGGAVAGWAGTDGAALLVEGKLGLEVVHGTAGKQRRMPLTLTGLTLAAPRRDARILWGQLVVLATADKDKEPVLAAGAITPTGEARIENIGPLPKASSIERGSGDPRIDGCKGGGIIAARAQVGRDAYITFMRDGRWSPPFKMATSGGALQCFSGGALTTYVSGGSGEAALDAQLVVQRCSATECRTKALRMRDFYAGEAGLASSSSLGVTAIEGKLAVAWLAGQRGGLRLRVGEFESLQTVPDTIVFDDFIKDGQVVDSSTILDMKALRAERFSVLLLATPIGLRALRVGPDGKAEPVRF